MAARKIDLRLHARVMNRKQWDELDDVRFSDEVQEILGDNWLDKSDRSLIIKRTINYKGFLFINPFFQICDAIKYSVGDCLLIADYSGSESGYLCEIGELSESEVEVPKKLLASPIENIEEWVRNCGKSTPNDIVKIINSFYGEESDNYWAPSNDIVEMEVGGKKVRMRVVSADLSESEEEETESNNLFDSLVDFSKTLNKLDKMQEKVVTDADRFVLTYNEGKIAKGPNYTMAIPDGFIIEEETGRDFVAYLPEVDEQGKPIKDITESIIAIYPGIVNEQNNETEYIKSLEYYKAFSEYSYYLAKEAMGALYAGKEYVPVLCQYVSGGGTVDKKNTHYFYNINIFMNGESKRFRFDVKGARKETEDIVYKMVLRLLDGITPAEKPYVFVVANDESFIVEKVSKKAFEKWRENLNILNKEINIIFLMYTNLVLKKRFEMGDIKKTQLKKECEKVLKESAAKWSKHYEEVIDFIRRLSSINKGNKVLIDYYDRAVELIDGNEDLNITLTDFDIKLQEVICDKKSTLEKLLTPEIKDLLESQGRNTNPEELRKQREIEKRKKEIEERKRTWEEQNKADKKGRQLISRMQSGYKSFEREFQSNASRHKRMIERHSFEGPWDPDLQRYFEMFGEDIESFGSQVEELIKESLDEYNKLNSIVSAEVSIDILDEIENLIDEVNDTSIGDEQLGIEHTYTWGIDESEIKSECRRLKQELRSVAKEQQKEREKQEKEDRDFEEAIKYGVEIKDLPKHRIYVDACQLRKKAKNSVDYTKVAKKFNSIKGYLDSDELRAKCVQKATQLKNIEKEKKEKEEAEEKARQEAERIRREEEKAREEARQEAERIRKEEEKAREEARQEAERIRREDEKERVKIPHVLAFRREYEKRSIIKKKIVDAAYYNDEGSAVYYHTVGLRDNGTVVAVGNNDYGQCEVDSWQDIIAIDCGYGTTIGLKSDGTVVVAGRRNDKKQEVSSWKDIVAISIGSDGIIVGLKSNGRVVTTDKYRDTSSWTDIGAIVATGSHIVGLKIDGTVVAVGFNDDGECNVSAWSDIVDITAEYGITVGLKSDGTIVAVGDSTYYQLSDLSSWADIVSITIGVGALIGLRSDGTVVAVGYNDQGQCNVDSWTNIIAIDSKYGTTLGLKADGTVVAVGYNGEAQCAVSSLRNIVEVWSTGSTVALKKDGSLLLVGEGMPKEEAETILGWELFSDSTKLAKDEKEAKESLKAMQQKYQYLKEKRLREEKECQMQHYRAAGVCQHCGGKFKGLFTKKCSSCGIKKDYK